MLQIDLNFILQIIFAAYGANLVTLR